MKGENQRAKRVVWEEAFPMLESFIAEYGRLPKKSDVYRGFRIGKWCENQKARAKSGNYPQERYEQLMQIGLLQNVYEEQWEKTYAVLLDYLKEYDHFPTGACQYKGYDLSQWCVNQKRRAVEEKYPQERVEKLRCIGLFDDVRAEELEERWEWWYQLLQEFMEKYGRVPKVTEVYQEQNLGTWYSRQKKLLQLETYPIVHREKLEALGIRKATVKEDWERHYQELCEFIAEYQRMPKQKEEYRGFKLGLWCTRQKQQAKKERYPIERRKKLEAVGLL